MPRQTSIQVTEATRDQAKSLWKYGTFTDVVRMAIDRMYREEREMNHSERLQRIEALLGQDGSQEAAELMDQYLPDADWTDQDWADALDKVSHRLYGPYADGKQYQMAVKRIAATPELEPYRYIILYDWQEGREHWAWVSTAPTQEIIDWCESIRQDEEDQEFVEQVEDLQ